MAKRLIAAAVVIFLGYNIYNPERHAKHYSYIEDFDVLGELIQDDSVKESTNLKDCKYDDVILNGEELSSDVVLGTLRFHLPDAGGEYKPTHCNPLYKTAVVIPYRNRKKQLETFMNYIHHFLQTQLIHYKIFIAEQSNDHPFNRAMMLNYAAVEAMKQGFKCLILHDVDLIPLTTSNIYACSRFPRHMTSSVDTFRFNLPYLGLFGGVISIQSDQFKFVNGMSNVFEGWGGEDDDFYSRLESANFLPYRFSPFLSKYMMLKHRKEKPSADRYEKLKNSLERQMIDGLNTLKENQIVKSEQLFTRIIVP